MGRFANLFESKQEQSPVSVNSSTGRFRGLFEKPGAVAEKAPMEIRALTPARKAQLRDLTPQEQKALDVNRNIRLIQGAPNWAKGDLRMRAIAQGILPVAQDLPPDIEKAFPGATFTGQAVGTLATAAPIAKMTAGIVPIAEKAIPMGKELFPRATKIIANVLHSAVTGAGVGGIRESAKQIGRQEFKPVNIAKEAGWTGLEFAPWGIIPATTIGANLAKPALTESIKRGAAAAGAVGAGTAGVELLRKHKLDQDSLTNIAINSITAGLLHGYKGNQIAEAQKNKEINDFMDRELLTRVKSRNPDISDEEARVIALTLKTGIFKQPAIIERVEAKLEKTRPSIPKEKLPMIFPEKSVRPVQPMAGGQVFSGKLALKPDETLSGVKVVQTFKPAEIKDIAGEKLNFGANDSIFTYPIVSQSTGKFTGKVMVKDGDKGIVSLPKDLTPEEAKLKIEEKITGRGEMPSVLQPLAAEAKKYTNVNEFIATVNKPYSNMQGDVSRGIRAAFDLAQGGEGARFTDYDIETQKDWFGRYTDWETPIPKENKITIYRATKGNDINMGDYVTQNKAYAEGHLENILRGEGKVVSITVNKNDLIPVNPNEFWYVPKELSKYKSLEDFYFKVTSQPIAGGSPLEKRQATMQERLINVGMAKDRIAEINNVRKHFLRRIRRYKQGYLKEELQGIPAKYITLSGGIAPDEALQDLRDNYGVDLPNESALKDYFGGLDKEINELKGIIATNKPKIVARTEATILKQEQKLTEGLQKKFSGQAKKIIQEAAKVAARMEKKAFRAGKATEAERRKVAYFGPQRSEEERSKLYLLAKEKGLYYTDYKGKPHDKLAGILRYYPEASFDQLREYISALTGDPQNPPKLFKLHGDITKDTEVIKLLRQVSDNWQDINTVELHTLDPARIVEKVTQRDLWDDNILADNTFSVYAAADEAMYDRLTRENADLITNKMNIQRGSKESSELMRKFEAGEPLTEREKQVAAYLRKKYDAHISEANEMRLRLGKKPIPYRKDYMTHILEQNLLADFFKGDIERMGEISPEQLDAIRKGDYTKGNMPFNRFALRRKGKKTKYDAIGNYEIYLKTILREIYYTPAINHARKFIEYALVKQPNAYKALDRLANDLKGKPSIEDQNAIGRLASFAPIKKLRSLQAKSALLGNINFWLMNSSNFAISYDELGNYMNKGLVKFLGNKKWRDFAFKHSNMLKGRTIDPDIEPSKLKFIEEIAGYITNLLEYNNVGSTFVGAYFKGIDLGYPQAKATKYADAIARRTQVGYKKFELNAWMRSNAGMLVSQFQSWTFNAMNHILYDLGVANVPRNLLGKFTGQKARPIKYGKLFTLLAVGMLLNLAYRKLGLREPYLPESAMPRIPGLGGAVPPTVRIGQNIGMAFTGKKLETRQKAAIRAGLSFIPGGTQIGRIFSGKLLPENKGVNPDVTLRPKSRTIIKPKKRF